MILEYLSAVVIYLIHFKKMVVGSSIVVSDKTFLISVQIINLFSY